MKKGQTYAMKEKWDSLHKDQHAHQVVDLKSFASPILQRVEPNGAQNEEDDRKGEK